MKHIMSVSLGSSTRDHKFETELLGEKYLIERIGLDGDLKKLKSMITSFDGKVDAFGLGGITLEFPVGKKTYYLRSAIPLVKAAQITPIVDGTGLKMVLERQVILDIDKQGIIPLKGKKILLTVAFDRFSMAQAFDEIGCETNYGDLIFSFGLPIMIKSFKTFECVSRFLAPIVCLLPIEMLYPTGKREEYIEDPLKFAKYYHEADVIAGDFIYIRRYMPEDLSGKIIITNTVTKENIEELRNRGTEVLVTTTPNHGGRSFGTNVIQAVIVAALGKRPSEISADDYSRMIKELGFSPRIEWLQKKV